MADAVVSGLKTLTMLVHIVLGLCVVLFFVHRHTAKKVLQWFNRNWWTAFVVAITATLGSLYLSNIAGYDPCNLCWWQRIFMYPLSIILAIAWWKKDKGAFRYVIPLAVIGAGISIYHYIIQLFPVETACDATGVSCAASPFFAYGYITIPTMALTAFVLIIVILSVTRKSSN